MSDQNELYHPEPAEWIKDKMREVNRKRELLVGYDQGKIVNRRKRENVVDVKPIEEWPTPDVRPFQSPIKYKNRRPANALEMSYLSKQLD